MLPAQFVEHTSSKRIDVSHFVCSNFEIAFERSDRPRSPNVFVVWFVVNGFMVAVVDVVRLKPPVQQIKQHGSSGSIWIPVNGSLIFRHMWAEGLPCLLSSGSPSVEIGGSQQNQGQWRSEALERWS